MLRKAKDFPLPGNCRCRLETLTCFTSFTCTLTWSTVLPSFTCISALQTWTLRAPALLLRLYSRKVAAGGLTISRLCSVIGHRPARHSSLELKPGDVIF